jgi:hypothetical protein
MPASVGAEALRVGVLTPAGTPLANVGDLVVATLGTEPGIELVERDQIAAVLRELELATALGPDAVGVRLRLGTLLHADLLVMLGLETEGDARYVRVVVSDTTVGARLVQDRLALDESPGTLATMICDRFRTARHRRAVGIGRIVAIPPLVSRSLTHELDQLQQRLPHVLEEAFSGLPGTAVLEVEEVQAIRRELDLRGTGLQSRVVPWFVNGEYRQQGGGAQPGAAIDLVLTLTDGASLCKECRQTFASVDELVVFLRTKAVPQLVGEGGAAVPLTIEQQLARMESRATAFERLGEFGLAAEIREACLLFAPDDVPTLTRLIRRYAERTRARPSVDWYQQRPDQVRAAWTERPAGWRRGLELLDYAIRRELLTQYQALALHRVLSEAIDRFIGSGPTDPVQSFEVDDPGLLSLLDHELAACTQAHRRFCTERFSHIRNLPRGEPEPDDLRPRVQEDPRSAWYKGLFAYPDHRRRRPGRIGVEIRPELLAHYAGVVARERSSNYGVAGSILQLFERFTTASPSEHSAMDADFARFLTVLQNTGDPLDAVMARLGRLLCQRFRLPRDQQPDSATMNQEAIAVEQELRRITGTVPPILLRLRRELAGQTAPEPYKHPIGEALGRALFLGESEEPTYQLDFERVDLRVWLRDGREEPFGELTWANQPGFVSEWCPPWGLEHVGVPLDVLWSGCYVLVEHEPGLLEPLVLDHGAEVRCVRCDASYIWVGSRTRGLQVFDLAGNLVQTVNAKSGLPPCDRELVFVLPEPGQAVACGSFGAELRTWCARIDITVQPAKVDILLEATETAAADRNRDAELVGALSPQEQQQRRFRTAFTPGFMDLYRDPLASGRPLVYIDRIQEHNEPQPPLLLDLQRRTGRIVQMVKFARTIPLFTVRPVFLPDGNLVVPDQEQIIVQGPPGRFSEARNSQRVVYEDLRVSHGGVVWADDGYVYAPTLRYWVRIDPETLAAERLGLRPQFEPQAGEDEYVSSSAHFGLVMYTSAGKFFKIHVTPRDSAPVSESSRVRLLQVVDSITQSPLSQATVEFEHQHLHRNVRVDEDGRAEVPAGMETSMATALAEGYAPSFVVLRDGGHPRGSDGSLKVSLHPVLRLAGQVVGPDGQPTAGTRVRALIGLMLGQRDSGSFETYTNSDGRWSLTLLREPNDPLKLSFNAGPEVERIFTPTLEELALLKAGDHVYHLQPTRRAELAHSPAETPTTARSLPPGVKTGFDVLVCDPAGRPLPNAEVRSQGRDDLPTKAAPQQRRTDSTGRCTIEGPFSSPLVVKAAGYADHVEPKRFPRPPDGVCQVHLTPAAPVNIRVVDTNEVAQANVDIAVNPSQARALYTKKGLTGPDGTLAWEFVPTGEIDWSARKDGRDLYVMDARPGAAGEFVVHVRAKTVVHVFGDVTDSVTGQPVREFEARLQSTEPRRRDAPSPPAANGTFVGGRLDLYVTEPVGAYEVQVEAQGYMPLRKPVELAAGTETRLDVQLRASAGLRVNVRRPDGSPAIDTQVLSTLYETESISGVPLQKVRGDDELLRTDETGAVVFAPRLGTVTLLAADQTGLVFSTADENTNEITMTLGAWPSVEGTWQRVPDGLPETRLRLMPVWRGDSNSRTSPRIETVVDADGHFEFPRVLPGDYWLSRGVHIMFTDSRGTLGEDRFTRVRLEPGQHLHLDVKATGRPVTGRLVHGDGSPIGGEEFRGSLVRHPTPKPPSNFREMSRTERETWNNEHRFTFHLQFDREGGLLGREVPPGTYRLDVQGETPVGEGMRPFQVRGLEVVVPPWPEDTEPTRFDIGDINVDQVATRPAAGSTGRLPPPPPPKEKPDWAMIGLQGGAGALVLAALGLSVHRRWRTRCVQRAPSTTLPLLLLSLVWAGSVQGLGQQAEPPPDTSALLPIVRAVEAYKHDCGLWPQRLEDLIPTYANSAGPGFTYEWSWTGYVHVACPSGRDQLVFVFNGDDRGWYTGRPGRYRMLAIPPPTSVEPPRPRLELLEAARKEFDRRIEREPNNPEHRQAKIAFYYRAGAMDDARQAALDWVAADSRAIAPRYALARIVRKERSGLDDRWGRTEVQHEVGKAWAERSRSSYGLWRVFAEPASDGMAAKRRETLLAGPLYRDRTEWLYTEVYLVEDAKHLSHPSHKDQLLNLCAKWEAAAQEISDPPPDRSYFAFRTIAHLRLGDYDAAAADLAEAQAAYAAGRSWVDPRPLGVYLRDRRELPEYLELADMLDSVSENDFRIKLNCPPPEP